VLRYLAAFLATGVCFMAMDFTWLSQTGALLYRPIIGELLSPSVRIGPAIAFYVIYIAGLIFFAVAPALKAGRWTRAFVNGAFFAICAYATYDLTNQATMKVWSLNITLADMAWGAVVSSVTACVGYFTARLLTPKGEAAAA
jgi:uncharacterized membrane protein